MVVVKIFYKIEHSSIIQEAEIINLMDRTLMFTKYYT